MARPAKRLFHRTIRRHRKQHWEEFLGDSDNIWRAAKYLDSQAGSSFARVPPIKKAGTEDEMVTDIAQELLNTGNKMHIRSPNKHRSVSMPHPL